MIIRCLPAPLLKWRINIWHWRIRSSLQEFPGRYKTLIRQHAIMPFGEVDHLSAMKQKKKGGAGGTGTFEHEENKSKGIERYAVTLCMKELNE